MTEKINHPPHYTSHPSGVECIAITEHLNFCVGNAIKYLWRAGLKGERLEDLKKARWYVDREIKRLESIETVAKPMPEPMLCIVCSSNPHKPWCGVPASAAVDSEPYVPGESVSL